MVDRPPPPTRSKLDDAHDALDEALKCPKAKMKLSRAVSITAKSLESDVRKAREDLK